MKMDDLVCQFLMRGEASLGEIYAHFTGEFVARTIREVSRAVERLEEKGIIKEVGRKFRFSAAALDARRPPRAESAHARLWRAAHQRTLRGGFTRRDLILLARVNPSSADQWCRGMHRAGWLRVVGRRGQAYVYRVAAGAPGPEQPPPWRWPRRGKARSWRDRA
jgi:hypothetical protein